MAVAAVAIAPAPAATYKLPPGFIQCVSDARDCRSLLSKQGWKQQYEGSDGALIMDANTTYEVMVRGDKAMLCLTHYVRATISSMLCLSMNHGRDREHL